MVARAELRTLMRQEPQLTQRELALRLKRSLGWVQKWQKRLRESDATDLSAVQRKRSSQAPKRPKRSAWIVERVLALREELPATLNRIPGPKALLYYLAQDEHLLPHEIPRSTRTIWQILDEAGRIQRDRKRETQPLDLADPMQVWQMDWKDATTAQAETSGKQQHQVEILNVVDTGTSLLLDSLPRSDYTAQTAILALTNTLQQHGRPRQITFDRDPRFVGSWTSGGFPSALMRFLLSLGIEAQLTPPHRPDKNAYVERFHRTLEYECLRVFQPGALDAVKEVTTAFKDRYNHERPNQARSCGNQPPSQAFPNLPRLPALPAFVDPDAWLQAIDSKLYKRRIKHNGSVTVDKHTYYIRQSWQGRDVVLQVDAAQRQFVVLLDSQPVKRIPIKGLHGELLPFDVYLDLICEEAVSEHRRWLRKQRLSARRNAF